MDKIEKIAEILGSALKELGEVPSGEFYARLCGKLDIDTYMAAIAVLEKQGSISTKFHLLKWIK